MGIGTRAGAYCGGTIVTSKFVVTAAHCGVLVFIGTYSSDIVVAGAYDYFDRIEVFLKTFKKPQYEWKVNFI